MRYLERGWFFAEPDGELTKLVRAAWKLDDMAGVPRTLVPEEQTRALVVNAVVSQRDNNPTVVAVVLIIGILVAATRRRRRHCILRAAGSTRLIVWPDPPQRYL